MNAPRTMPRTAPLSARLASSSSPSSSRNTSSSPRNTKKSKAEILEVKRKAISLLTTAYKADNDEKVDELEAQLKDLLHLIRPAAEDLQSTTKTDSATSTTTSAQQEKKTRPLSMPSPPSTAVSTSPAPGILLRDFNGRTKPNPIQAHIGEIRKPMKQFHAQTATIEPIKSKKGVVAGMQQEAFLEAAMGRSQVKENAGWMGFLFGPGDDDSETGFKEFGEMGGKGLRKKQKARRRAAKRSSGDSASDAFAGMIVTTSSSSSKNGTNKSVGSSQASSISSGSFDSEDDVSTLGTEPTYDSASERMAGFLQVRRLPTTAEEEDETSPEGWETTAKDAVVLQDIAEEESPAAADVETPIWRWFQPRAQVPA